RAANGIRAGAVYINMPPIPDQAAPWGGFKASGWGREMGKYAIDAFTEPKGVWMHYGYSATPWRLLSRSERRRRPAGFVPAGRRAFRSSRRTFEIAAVLFAAAPVPSRQPPLVRVAEVSSAWVMWRVSYRRT